MNDAPLTAFFNAFSGPDGTPTLLERQLIEASAMGSHGEGRSIYFGFEDEIGEELNKYGETEFHFDAAALLDITVSAQLIQTLATGRFAHPDWPKWCLHEQGFSLAGALIPDKIELKGLRLAGDLYFEDCYLLKGMNLEQAHISGDLSLDNCVLGGLIELIEAQIGGAISLQSSILSVAKQSPWAIYARDCSAKRLNLQGTEAAAGIMLAGAELGTVNLTKLKLSPRGPIAINASRMRALSLDLSHSKFRGQVDIAQSEISGQVKAFGTTIQVSAGVALSAYLCTFGGAVFIRSKTAITGGVDFSAALFARGFEMTDCTIMGSRDFAVRCDSARVEGGVTLTRSTFTGLVYARALCVSQALNLRDSLLCASLLHEEDPAHPMPVAQSGHAFDKEQDFALKLREAEIGGALTLPFKPVKGVIDLGHTSCNLLIDCAESWPPALSLGQEIAPARAMIEQDGTTRDVQHLVLDGFTYRYLEFPDGRSGDMLQGISNDIAQARVRWLSAQAASDLHNPFNPQPWRQAASVLREMGYDRASQYVAIQRRVHERHSRDTPFRQRWINLVLQHVADYGYNPWKALLYCMVVIVIMGLLHHGAVALCGQPLLDEIAARCSSQLYVPVRFGDVAPKDFVSNYPAFSPFAFSLDTFVPLFDLGSETYWRPSTASWLSGAMPWAQEPLELPLGWILYIGFIVERILGAILLAIAITGFTGLLTREEK